MNAMQEYPTVLIGDGASRPNESHISTLARNMDCEVSQWNGVHIGYLKPVCGALAWAWRRDAKGAVMMTEEGPFVAREHAGEEGVVC